MRIAISGAHRTGKSTLVEALADALPGYEAVAEPYHLLEEDGHEFADEPSIEDFEAQLERSIACVHGSAAHVIFDRCPLDIVGYLLTHPDSEVFELADWLPRVQAAVERLDLIVFVPVEEPDRIPVPRSHAPESRAEVHATLENMVLDDCYGFGVEVMAVTGSLAARVQQIVTRVSTGSAEQRVR